MIHGKTIILKSKLESFKLPRPVLRRLKIYMILKELFSDIFPSSCRGKLEWCYSSLSGRSPNTD